MKAQHTAVKCSGDAMIGKQCPNPAKWVNQNGVCVCDHHKTLLDAFTWESRNTSKWEALAESEV